MVAGGDGVEAEGFGAGEQPIELEMAIAFDAGVRRTALRMGGDVRTDHVAGEVVPEVEHKMVDAELLGRPPRVVDVRHRATTGVAVPTPELHRDADHLMTVGNQPGRGNRGIDAAGHGGQDLHGRGPDRRGEGP